MKIQIIIEWDEIPETENIIYLAEKLCALGFKPTQFEYLELMVEVDENRVVLGYQSETNKGAIDIDFNFAGWIDDKARESVTKEEPRDLHDQNLIDMERGK